MNGKQKGIKAACIIFVLLIPCFLHGYIAKAQAAEIQAISEYDILGSVDGEFSMIGFKGLYRWNVQPHWTSGSHAIRKNDTFGVVNGEFSVDSVLVNSNTLKILFDNSAKIRGKSDNDGKIIYLPDQKASFSSALPIFVNSMLRVVPLNGKINLEVKNGYLTCADGTKAELVGLWIDKQDEKEERMWTKTPSPKYNGMMIPFPLFKPVSFEELPTIVTGTYKNGRISFDPGQRKTIYSKGRILLEDGTILLPNSTGKYTVEIKEGLPTFVDVTIYERKGNEELFKK
jgi:hypothetical protein